MNTLTDVSIISGIQLQYCVDHAYSPEGMTLPSTAAAATTGSSDPFSSGGGVVTGTATRSRPTSGPVATNTSMFALFIGLGFIDKHFITYPPICPFLWNCFLHPLPFLNIP